MSALIQSLPCPGCSKRILLPVTEEEAEALHTPGVTIQAALVNYCADIRERFVTGWCPSCWSKKFGSDGVLPPPPRTGDV